MLRVEFLQFTQRPGPECVQCHAIPMPCLAGGVSGSFRSMLHQQSAGVEFWSWTLWLGWQLPSQGLRFNVDQTSPFVSIILFPPRHPIGGGVGLS